MANDDITVSISQESIQAIVKAKIQGELIQALTKGNGADKLVERLVAEALAAKVERNYRSVSFMDDLITNVIQAETKKAFQAWIEMNRQKIQDGIQKALAKDRTLSTRLMDALLNTVQNNYRVAVNIGLPKDE